LGLTTEGGAQAVGNETFKIENPKLKFLTISLLTGSSSFFELRIATTLGEERYFVTIGVRLQDYQALNE